MQVFISYSWANYAKRGILTEELRHAGALALYDEREVPVGDDLWSTISSFLNKADYVVPLLTHQSVTNPRVLEEMVRAHERNIPIIPLCEQGIDTKQLPSFIDKALQIRFSDDVDLSVQCRAKLIPQLQQRENRHADLPFPRKRYQSIFRNLREIEAMNQPFRERMADAILESLDFELDRLSENFSIDLGAERNFLLRARPLFASADKVYATSLQNISTFWLSKDLRRSAREYIQNQASYTVRLFVFDNALSSHMYSNILQFHHESYGATGAVLLCSTASYRKLLHRLGVSADVIRTDFAFLDVDGVKVLAELDGKCLKFEVLKRGRTLDFPIHPDSFTEQMNQLANTTPGECNPGAEEDDIRVLRWSPMFIDDRASWSIRLKQMFDSDAVSGDVYHQITFTNAVDHRAIIKARDDLLAMHASGTLEFESVWLGQRYSVEIQDGVHNAPLNAASDDHVYVLIIRFINRDDYYRYMASKEHSRVRRDLYSSFDQDIADLYQKADDLPKSGKARSQIFRDIEALASNFMVRRDFAADQWIDDIVKTKPYAFSVF
ncbi:MAG: toll/interleukin-1 receptor domain-containing protein [Caulobacter sp.]